MSETAQSLRVKATDFDKAGDYESALSMLDRACKVLIYGRTRDYHGAASVKECVGEILIKQGLIAAAIAAYTMSANFYEKGGDKKTCMLTLAKTAYLCIEKSFYWDALFLFERLYDYYVRIDRFKCSKFSYDACLCLLAHNQLEDLGDLFTMYQDHLATLKEKETVKLLISSYKSDKSSLNREEWASVVFKHLSTT